MVETCGNGNDVFPVAHGALPAVGFAHGHNRAVILQAHGVVIAGVNGDNAGPGIHIALAVDVVACRRNRTVGPQTHGVLIACGDIDDPIPAADNVREIPFADVSCVAGKVYCAVRLQTQRIVVRRGHIHDVLPYEYIAFVVVVGACGDEGSVASQAEGVVSAGKNRHDIRPAVDAALIVHVLRTHGHHGSVSLQTDGMTVAGCDAPGSLKRVFPGLQSLIRGCFHQRRSVGWLHESGPGLGGAQIPGILSANLHQPAVGFHADGQLWACADGDNACPTGNVALLARGLPDGSHGSVGMYAEGIISAGGNGDDILPAVHTALAVGVAAHCHNRTVFFQTDRVIVAGGNAYDVGPVIHIAFVQVIRTCGDYRSVGFQANHMGASVRKLHDIHPVSGVLSAAPGVSGNQNRTVGFDAHGAVLIGIDFFHIAPGGELCLAELIPSGGDHFAVLFQADGVAIACGNGHNIRPVLNLGLFIDSGYADGHSASVLLDAGDVGIARSEARCRLKGVFPGGDFFFGRLRYCFRGRRGGFRGSGFGGRLGFLGRRGGRFLGLLRCRIDDAGDDNGVVGLQTDGEGTSRANRKDIRPIVHIALSEGIVAGGNRGAVHAQTHRVVLSGVDCHDAGPAFHVGLSEGVDTHCLQGTVRAQTHGVVRTGGDGDDVGPSFHFALIVGIAAHGDHGTVRLQTDGMVFACGDGNDVLPGVRIALAAFIAACGDNGSV